MYHCYILCDTRCESTAITCVQPVQPVQLARLTLLLALLPYLPAAAAAADTTLLNCTDAVFAALPAGLGCWQGCYKHPKTY